MVQLWSPEKLRRDYITSDPSATRGPSGKATVHEGHINTNDAEFDPDPHGPRVKPGDPNSSECLPHVPAVEGWKPGETYSVGDEDPADDDPAKYRLQYPVV